MVQEVVGSSPIIHPNKIMKITTTRGTKITMDLPDDTSIGDIVEELTNIFPEEIWKSCVIVPGGKYCKAVNNETKN